MLGNPIPGLTCHFPDVPGSHNPTGKEAWTSGVWRGEYPGVKETWKERGMMERDGDTHRDTQMETDGWI